MKKQKRAQQFLNCETNIPDIFETDGVSISNDQPMEDQYIPVYQAWYAPEVRAREAEILKNLSKNRTDSRKS